MSENNVYLFRAPIGLPKAAKREILDVIERSEAGHPDESMFPEIQGILQKYGFILVTQPVLAIERNPELPKAI